MEGPSNLLQGHLRPSPWEEQNLTPGKQKRNQATKKSVRRERGEETLPIELRGRHVEEKSSIKTGLSNVTTPKSRTGEGTLQGKQRNRSAGTGVTRDSFQIRGNRGRIQEKETQEHKTDKTTTDDGQRIMKGGTTGVRGRWGEIREIAIEKRLDARP